VRKRKHVWFVRVGHESLLHYIIEGRRGGRLHAPVERSDKRKALKRAAEVRREWQRLLRAGSRTPASQQITSMNEWIAPCFVGRVMI